jgi:hypothetical protein
MNFKRLLVQSAIACVALTGEALLTYFFNRRTSHEI